MDPPRLQLAELLDFRPDEGIIRLHEQRVVILSAAAMGLLRKELIDTLGLDTARRLLMRFGYADGYHDAVSLRDRKAWSNPVDGLRTGAVVHTLEGIVRADLTSVDFDPGTGRFAAETQWHDSY
jgi:two-component system response regulator HydG